MKIIQALRRFIVLIDLPDSMFFGGLLLLYVGASRILDGLGEVMVGALLIAYIKPVRWWFR